MIRTFKLDSVLTGLSVSTIELVSKSLTLAFNLCLFRLAKREGFVVEGYRWVRERSYLDCIHRNVLLAEITGHLSCACKGGQDAQQEQHKCAPHDHGALLRHHAFD